MAARACCRSSPLQRTHANWPSVDLANNSPPLSGGGGGAAQVRGQRQASREAHEQRFTAVVHELHSLPTELFLPEEDLLLLPGSELKAPHDPPVALLRKRICSRARRVISTDFTGCSLRRGASMPVVHGCRQDVAGQRGSLMQLLLPLHSVFALMGSGNSANSVGGRCCGGEARPWCRG